MEEVRVRVGAGVANVVDRIIDRLIVNHVVHALASVADFQTHSRSDGPIGAHQEFVLREGLQIRVNTSCCGVTGWGARVDVLYEAADRETGSRVKRWSTRTADWTGA